MRVLATKPFILESSHVCLFNEIFQAKREGSGIMDYLPFRSKISRLNRSKMCAFMLNVYLTCVELLDSKVASVKSVL